MSDHNCTQEKELGMLRSSVDRMEKELFNGNGLSDIVAKSTVKIDTLIESVNDLKTNVSALVKFEAATEGIVNYKENAGHNKTTRTAQIIGVIIASLMLCFTAYSSVRNHKGISELKTEVVNSIDNIKK